jgi:hypothetical protein
VEKTRRLNQRLQARGSERRLLHPQTLRIRFSMWSSFFWPGTNS